MSYELTKILPLFVYPLGLGILLFMLTVVAVARGAKRVGMVAGLSGLLVLWIASMPITAASLTASLEDDYPFIPASDQQDADAIVVLGGFTTKPAPWRGDVELNDAVDRLLHGMRLLRAGKAQWIMLLGGAARGQTPESEMMMQVLAEFGVPREKMLSEASSRNTRENAEYALPVMRRHGIDRILLVTSATHMKRARAVFEKLGLEVIPAATDYQVGEPDPGLLNWLPDAEALNGTTVALKEYIGWIVYRLRGWI